MALARVSQELHEVSAHGKVSGDAEGRREVPAASPGHEHDVCHGLSFTFLRVGVASPAIDLGGVGARNKGCR
jgi:hypothetical protein